jgi:hypothetical protein
VDELLAAVQEDLRTEAHPHCGANFGTMRVISWAVFREPYVHLFASTLRARNPIPSAYFQLAILLTELSGGRVGILSPLQQFLKLQQFCPTPEVESSNRGWAVSSCKLRGLR